MRNLCSTIYITCLLSSFDLFILWTHSWSHTTSFVIFVIPEMCSINLSFTNKLDLSYIDIIQYNNKSRNLFFIAYSLTFVFLPIFTMHELFSIPWPICLFSWKVVFTERLLNIAWIVHNFIIKVKYLDSKYICYIFDTTVIYINEIKFFFLEILNIIFSPRQMKIILCFSFYKISYNYKWEYYFYSIYVMNAAILHTHVMNQRSHKTKIWIVTEMFYHMIIVELFLKKAHVIISMLISYR